MKDIIAFIKSKIFWKNIAIMAAITVVLVFLLFKGINIITKHGETITVPDLIALDEATFAPYLAKKNLNYVITDSVFSADHPKGTVLDQDPVPNDQVKEGRTIYLTIVAFNPPKVQLPDLNDLTLREARSILSNFGLRIGELIYRRDLAENMILEVRLNGEIIKPGMKIEKNATVDLVLGNGLGFAGASLPDLVGLTLEEAKFVIQSASLNLGKLYFESSITDSLGAVVIGQEPEYNKDSVQSVPLGASVNLILKQN
ncbi:MAG: beta-lactam-binding protein with PASTA domain [Sphingobacteriales bacterium]|jgi:beta-lactam-binding protein with PASTA domain